MNLLRPTNFNKIHLFSNFVKFLLVLSLLQLTGCGTNRMEHGTQVGLASWYGRDWEGRLTANGERFHADDYTAAHRTLPFNTIVLVENLKNGRKVKVRINDRGPYKHGRIIDLSEAAAHALAVGDAGVIRVRIRVVNE